MNKFTTTVGDRIFVPKNWGWEDWLWNGPDYCGKLLFFYAGKRCSWHFHGIKDEVLFLQSGMITMKYSENDDLENAESVIMTPGMAFHVIPEMRHQMIAIEESLMFEASTHHSEEDSIRVIKGD